MTQRSDEGGGRRGLPGLWAALVLVGLAVWSMQTGSVQGDVGGSGATNHTLTTSFSSSLFTHHSTAADCVGGTTATETVTLEDTIGPGTIIIGDRDAGGTAFQVLSGWTNLNVNTHTQTDTYVCDAVGIPTLSEWAQIGMVALLVLGGLAALQRRHTVRLIPRPRRPPPE